jgi:hypothetical protein
MLLRRAHERSATGKAPFRMVPKSEKRYSTKTHQFGVTPPPAVQPTPCRRETVGRDKSWNDDTSWGHKSSRS